MPNNILLSFSKKHNISMSKLEKDWNFAKKETEDNFNIKEKDFRDKHWSYVLGIVKNMNNIKESIKEKLPMKKIDEKMLATAFLQSKKSAKQFIEDSISGAISTTADTAELTKQPIVSKGYKEEDEDNLTKENEDFMKEDQDFMKEDDDIVYSDDTYIIDRDSLVDNDDIIDTNDYEDMSLDDTEYSDDLELEEDDELNSDDFVNIDNDGYVDGSTDYDPMLDTSLNQDDYNNTITTIDNNVEDDKLENDDIVYDVSDMPLE